MSFAPCYLFFDLFASENRIKIIMSLWNKPKTVKEICEETGIEQSNVSHQLKLMQRCRVVNNVRKEGRKRIYALEACAREMIETANCHIKRHCGGKCDYLMERKK